MRLVFKRIEIHNFMSFADETFDFSQFRGMNLICGKNFDIPNSKNGSGKSAIWNALAFSLFGDTPRKIKNTNIRNRFIKSKEVRVTTWVDIGDISYKISSGFNKNGGSYCEIYRLENGEEVDLIKSTIAETRKFIETEILHCDLSVFMRTIYLFPSDVSNFYALCKNDKKEFVEKLFDIQLFGEMYTKIHKDILNYDKLIMSKQSALMTLNKYQNDYSEYINKYNIEKTNKLTKLNESLNSYVSEYNTLKTTKITTNSAEVKKCEDAIIKIDDVIKQINKQILEQNSVISKFQSLLSTLKSEVTTKQKIIDKHSELMSKLCSDCKDIFSEYHNISTYINEINLTNKKILDINKKLDIANNRISDLTEKYNKLETKREQINEKIKTLTNEYNKVNQRIFQLESQIDTLKTTISKEENSINPYISLLETNTHNIDNETVELDSINNKYKYLKFAESIVSQDTIRKFIIKDLIGLLNNKIKVYLTKLGAKYSVVFDEDMNYDFITDAGKCEFNNFSAGEQGRIMIATCFAFRDFMAIRNNISSNILIIDEYLDSALDQLAVDSAISILKDYCKIYKQNIYLISHRSNIDNDIFNNIIQMQKHNNITHITILEENNRKDMN